jgi:threonyl-tRNA synthetase
MSALDLIDYIYTIFGMTYSIELSTRPKLKLGSEELWDGAEAALASALDDYGKPYTLNPGDGAFYGPKIDIKLQDSMNRKHQCGTI